MLINEETKIIPGHGKLATKADYQKYHDMLESVHTAIAAAIETGKTLEEVTAMEIITSDYLTDEESAKSFITGPKFRSTVYKSILENK